MVGTDREILHFISEHPELDSLLDRLAEDVSRKSIKWRHDPRGAKLHAVRTMSDRGLHGDYQGIKRYLKNNLVMMEIRGDILGINKAGAGCCPYRR